jgi:hypothetical protein
MGDTALTALRVIRREWRLAELGLETSQSDQNLASSSSPNQLTFLARHVVGCLPPSRVPCVQVI